MKGDLWSSSSIGDRKRPKSQRSRGGRARDQHSVQRNRGERETGERERERERGRLNGIIW